MLLVVGIDGASWELIDPWIAQGHLPTLARFRRDGYSGGAISTDPPITFPAWTSFATAAEPRSHGIFDFSRREGYGIRFVSSHDRAIGSIWGRLDALGKKVCVYNLPGSYPPERLSNGYFLSGFDSPVTTEIDASFVHPTWLHADLRRRHGSLVISDLNESRIGRDWHEHALATLLRDVRRRGEIARDLLLREKWDLCFVLFGESDTAGHHFWMLSDPRSPRYRPSSMGDAIRQVYSAIDEALAELLVSCPPETAVLVVSDHGMGGAGTRAISINRFLQERGFLAFQRSQANPLDRWLRQAALRFVPPNLQGWLVRGPARRMATRLEARSRFAGIDWGRTAAFSEELNYFPSIHLNVEGREPRGIVDPSAIDRVASEIACALDTWRDSDTGEPIVARVRRREEVHGSGPLTRLLPDLFVDLTMERGYSTTVRRSDGVPGPSAWRLGSSELTGAKGHGMNGTHRPIGIYGWYGAGIPRGDGPDQPLSQIGGMAMRRAEMPGIDFEALQTLADRPLATDLPDGSIESWTTAQGGYTAAQEAIVRERLRSLGYLD